MQGKGSCDAVKIDSDQVSVDWETIGLAIPFARSKFQDQSLQEDGPAVKAYNVPRGDTHHRPGFVIQDLCDARVADE